MSPPAVVITGASSGIGEACALDLVGRGFRVYAGVRKEADAQRLRDRGLPELVPVMLDVTDESTLRAAAGRITDEMGGQGIAGLVNNAGLAIVGPLETITAERLRHQYDVNVFGLVATTRAFLPLLRAGRGRIVNISSLSGILAMPFFGPYTSSKFAVEALSDCLRVEVQKWGIHVSVIEPGGVKTPIWQKSKVVNAEILGDAPTDSLALYKDEIQAVRNAAAETERTGMPVAWVTDAIRHALTAARPKTRYPLGHRSHLARLLRFWLPDRLRDRLLRRLIGLQ